MSARRAHTILNKQKILFYLAPELSWIAARCRVISAIPVKAKYGSMTSDRGRYADDQVGNMILCLIGNIRRTETPLHTHTHTPAHTHTHTHTLRAVQQIVTSCLINQVSFHHNVPITVLRRPLSKKNNQHPSSSVLVPLLRRAPSNKLHIVKRVVFLDQIHASRTHRGVLYSSTARSTLLHRSREYCTPVHSRSRQVTCTQTRG